VSRPVIHCNECGTQLENAKLSDEIFLLSPGKKQIGPQQHQRMFVGYCPEHGRRFVAFPNEGHSTLLASRLAKLFSNAERKKLRTILPAEERIIFQASLNGQYAWDESDVARWKEALDTDGKATK
jgi:hypothetical protein